MMIYVLVLIAIGVFLYVLAPKTKKESEEDERPGDEVNLEAAKKYFKFPEEVSFLLEETRKFLNKYRGINFPVNVPAFTLAVRQQEAGRAGREFGIMHPEAIDTDLETQLEWFLETLKKDTIRWNTGNLWQGWRKESFRDFIEYFARKYAPIGAENDPQGLNRFWEKNVRYYYELFRAKEVN